MADKHIIDAMWDDSPIDVSTDKLHLVHCK